MRWVLIIIGAIILLPILWSLLKFAAGLAVGVVQFAVVLAVIIFLVGLIRRLLLVR
jgi:hypothetical protein